ncbi:MAG: phage tail fiber protein [Frankiales bacterium]|nr:phage tail fiber protein [Frankiales bacterium]
MELTTALADEYVQLFDTCTVHHDKVAGTDAIADRAVKNEERYRQVADAVGCPWFVIAVLHSLEAGQRFTTHLHNGDPLTHRTVHVPRNRPRSGQPPFTWEVSARDALADLKKVPDWTVPVMLFQLERYNGFGYRRKHPEVLSPYLWSFTNHYAQGKFVADGKFSGSAVSKQCGAVALLVRMRARKDIALDAGTAVRGLSAVKPKPVPKRGAAGRHPFPGVALRRGDRGPNVGLVQAALRGLGHHIDVVAGSPFGPQTESAVIAFQKQHRLTPSGRVGSDTWKALVG